MALTGDELVSVEHPLGHPIAVKLSDLKASTAWDKYNVTLVGGMSTPRLLVSDFKGGSLAAGSFVPQCDAREAMLGTGDLNDYFTAN